MVASSEPLASGIGLNILKQGGNAADAAVAVAAALNVTEPSKTGIGGDAFCLFYNAKTKEVKGLNASGRAPAGLNLQVLRDQGIHGEAIPPGSIHSVTVPGAASGWVDTVKMFGSGKMSLAQILHPAIELAEEGFPVAPLTAYDWARSETQLRTASPNGAEMLKDNRAPRCGEIMKIPTLASTFRALAADGLAGFYKGRVAQSIVELVASQGGFLTLEDLASHASTPVTPISLTYNGTRVYECPPNGQGIVALVALGLLDAMQEQGLVKPLGEMGHNSVEYLHVLIEAMRIAFADGRQFVADPEKVEVPTRGLLDRGYLAERAKVFDPTRAAVDVVAGSPAHSCDTVYFSVVDAEGNACSFINSNYQGFGTGKIPKGCGFTLQNRGCNFILKEGHPNCIAPGKRPYHTIIPAMATRDSKLHLCFGVMGAFMQPQGHVQVLLNMEHFNADPQRALDLPRFCIAAIDGIVDLEEGINQEVVEGLVAMGHRVRVVSNFDREVFGRGQIIRVNEVADSPTGRVLAGGSDPRADGMAVGY
ncbi:hypothetical protein HK101_006651 [Irineochytrium annulatum]|nr:hypothetical protein HK101_006651 [Irineochytrium annulatum]